MKIKRHLNRTTKAELVSVGDIVSLPGRAYICVSENSDESNRIKFIDLESGQKHLLYGNTVVEKHPNAVLYLDGYPEEREK